MNLKIWLSQQGLSVREFALQMDVPLKTVQDWVYREKDPSPLNTEKLKEFMNCTHYWVIEVSHGPLSEGTCQLCGRKREFRNSEEFTPWSSRQTSARSNGTTRQNGSN